MGLPERYKPDRPPPFWKADPRVWPLIAETMAGREWPTEVVDEDLWWWLDQISQGYQKDLPSRRALMARWSWTERRVRDRLQLLGDWRSEWTSQQGPNKVPTRSQRGPNEVPGDNGPTPTSTTKGPSEVPARSQRGPNKVPARSTRAVDQRTETDVQSTEPEEHTGPPAEPVLVSPVEPPAKRDPWDDLAAHYGSLPFCRPPQKRHLGNGAHLSKLIKALGLADAKLVLDWWAYADDERARFLRDGSAEERAGRSVLEKRPPKYGLETIARPGKLEGYHERALAWQAGGRRQRRPDGVHGAGYSAAPPEAPDRLTDPDGYAAWVADDIPF